MNKSKFDIFLINSFSAVKVSTNVIAKDDSICGNQKHITRLNEKVVCAKFTHTTEQRLKSKGTLNIDYFNLNLAKLYFNEEIKNFSFSEYQYE